MNGDQEDISLKFSCSRTLVVCYVSSQGLQPVPRKYWHGQSTILLHPRQAGSAENSKRTPWWIPQWSLIAPQSLCIPFLTDKCLALELRVYPSRCSRSSEPPWFSQSLWLARFTLLLLEFLLSVHRAQLCFPGTAAPSRASSDMCSPHLPAGRRLLLPAAAEKNERQK